MTISPTVSLVLMWVFLIGMYIFKTADIEEVPALAAVQSVEVQQEAVEEQAEEAEVKSDQMNIIFNSDRKLKVYTVGKKDCDKNITVWSHSNGTGKVLWNSGSHAHGSWVSDKDHLIWSSDNGSLRVVSTDKAENKVYKLKDLKEIKKKYEKLKLKEGNKAISIYSSSPHVYKYKYEFKHDHKHDHDNGGN